MEDIKILNNKKDKGYITSISFFILVVVVTVSLFFYNKSIVNSIDSINNEISGYEVKINELESDKNIQIFSLIEANKKVLDSYQKMNNVTTFINHLDGLKTKYGIDFNGFDLSKLEIQTEVSSLSDTNRLAYSKVKNFIAKYREDKDSLFNLNFINSFEGMDDIKFKVKFTLKQ